MTNTTSTIRKNDIIHTIQKYRNHGCFQKQTNINTDCK